MKKWIYYGLFLDKDSRNTLLSFLENSNWDYLFEETSKIYLDHCTLLHYLHYEMNEMLASSIEEKLKWLIDEECTLFVLKVTHIGYNDKAIAFKVKTIPSKLMDNICFNTIPHITIGTFSNGQPVHSNDITNWAEIEPIEIKAYLKKV